MDKTLDMAREAGIDWTDFEINGGFNALKTFEALVRADERARLQPQKIKAIEDDYCHGDERYYAND